MDGCEDFTEADLVCFVCKKETQLLSDNILGLECLDIYAYGSPPHDICVAFPAKDKQGKIRVVSKESFKYFESYIKENEKQTQIDEAAIKFINNLGDDSLIDNNNESKSNEAWFSRGDYLAMICMIILIGMVLLHHFTGCTLHIMD